MEEAVLSLSAEKIDSQKAELLRLFMQLGASLNISDDERMRQANFSLREARTILHHQAEILEQSVFQYSQTANDPEALEEFRRTLEQSLRTLETAYALARRRRATFARVRKIDIPESEDP